MRINTKKLFAIALVAVMMASAGCAGWGTDGPANDNEPNQSADSNASDDQETRNDTNGSDTNDDSGQEQNDVEQNDGSGESTAGSDGGGDGDTDSSSADSDSSESSSDSSDSSSDSDDSKHADDTDEDGSDKQSSQPPANGGDDNEAPPTDGDGNESPPKNGDGNETPPDDDDPNETDPEPEPEGNTVTVDVVDLETDESVEIDIRLSSGDYEQTVTSTSGTATFENVPDGEYRISPATDGWWKQYGDEERLVVEGDTSHTMGVNDEPDTHTLTVTVTDAETGEPIEGATVSGVGGRHPAGADLLIQDETNADGVVTIDAYESGYLLDVSADGYEYPPNQEVNLNEDKSVSFELTPEDSGGENVTEPVPQPPANETNETAAAV